MVHLSLKYEIFILFACEILNIVNGSAFTSNFPNTSNAKNYAPRMAALLGQSSSDYVQPVFPERSDAVYFVVALHGGEKLWGRTLARTLLDLGTPFSNPQGPPLRPIIIDLPPNGKYSSKVLMTLCDLIDGVPLVGIIIVGDGQTAKMISLAGSSMKIPVLWAKGGVASIQGTANEHMSKTQVVLEPSAREFFEALRSLLLQLRNLVSGTISLGGNVKDPQDTEIGVGIPSQHPAQPKEIPQQVHLDDIRKPEKTTQHLEDGSETGAVDNLDANFQHGQILDIIPAEELAKKNAEIRKLRKKMADLQHEIVILTDNVLFLTRENQELKTKQSIPSVRLTTEDGINISLAEINDIDSTSSSDSLFVANLAIHFYGTDRLKNMSTTGQPTPRFKNKFNSDGTPMYPAREQIEPKIFKFILEKLTERVAQRLGTSKVKEIGYFANERIVRKHISQKISNLNKVARYRK